MKRKGKLDSIYLKNLIFKCINANLYVETKHVFQRYIDRGIRRWEIFDVLINGYHERQKDYYENDFQKWNYAIRGKTIDGKELRIVVSFEDGHSPEVLIIITAIDLNL